MNTPKFNELIDRLLSEKEVEVARVIPQKEYYLKSYDEIPSGTLSDDVRVTYDRLSGMSGEVHSGEAFIKQLQKSGLGSREINKLLNMGVLEASEEDKSEEVGALDVPEDEMSQRDRFSVSDVEDMVSPSFKSSRGFGED